MKKLKLGRSPDDEPVTTTVELPAPLDRDLVAPADGSSLETGPPVFHPTKLIVPMLERLIATDHALRKPGAIDLS